MMIFLKREWSFLKSFFEQVFKRKKVQIHHQRESEVVSQKTKVELHKDELHQRWWQAWLHHKICKDHSNVLSSTDQKNCQEEKL